MLGMCYILCWACKGAKAPVRGLGDNAPKKKTFFLGKHVTYLGGVWHMISLSMVLLFLVKELGLLTNPIHWVRVLDVVGSYMYIVF